MRRVDVRTETELVADSARGPERIVQVRCRSERPLAETTTFPGTASLSWGFGSIYRSTSVPHWLSCGSTSLKSIGSVLGALTFALLELRKGGQLHCRADHSNGNQAIRETCATDLV